MIEGSLPGVLLTLLEGVTPLQPSPAKTSPVDVVAAAKSWAQDIPERRCALIIAELVDGCGETARARAALEELAATYPQHRWKLVSGWSGETLVLKADDDAGDALRGQPLGFGDPARPTVVGLAPKLDQAPADLQNYADTLYGLSDVLDRLGEVEAAATIGERSILAGLYAGGRTRIVRGLGILADLRAEQDAQAAREEADRLYATAIKEATPDSLISANLMTNRGRNGLRLDRKEEAFGILLEAMQSFAALGDERGRVGVGLALAELSAGASETTTTRSSSGTGYSSSRSVWETTPCASRPRSASAAFIWHAATATGRGLPSRRPCALRRLWAILIGKRRCAGRCRARRRQRVEGLRERGSGIARDGEFGARAGVEFQGEQIAPERRLQESEGKGVMRRHMAANARRSPALRRWPRVRIKRGIHRRRECCRMEGAVLSITTEEGVTSVLFGLVTAHERMTIRWPRDHSRWG